MQLTPGIISGLLLLSGIIPSAAGATTRERTKTVYRTKTQWKTTTQKTTYFKSSTIINIRPWTIEETRRTTVTITTLRKEFPQGPVKSVTIMKRISSCEPKETERPSPTEKEEETFSTCPPSVTVTAKKTCDTSKPECPRQRRCVMDPARFRYGCNCIGAPARTITVTTRCPEECCGGYLPARYDLMAPDEGCPQSTGSMTEAPEATPTSTSEGEKPAEGEEETENQIREEPEEVGEDETSQEDEPEEEPEQDEE